MGDNMRDILFKYIESSDRAFVIGNVIRKEAYYCNEQAKKLYGIHTGTIDLEKIFVEETKVLKRELIKSMKANRAAFFYNIMTTTVDGSQQLADLQVGYIQRDQSEMFIEITPKIDNRMVMAKHQVNTSSRAEGIFNLDETLSLIHCNSLLSDIFSGNQRKKVALAENSLSSGFHEDMRETLLTQIHTQLQTESRFFTQMKVVDALGGERWYSLELQKRVLDDTNMEKVMAYMINIEKQRETENELDSINQYFEILEGMSKGLLYRYDIYNNVLYRNETTAKRYNLPMKQENFSSKEWLDHIMHPEDIDDFIKYIDIVTTGQEATHTARLKSADGDFEYHNFTFSPVYLGDGRVKEMVGCAINIQEKYDLESIAKNTKKQFEILERVCEDRLSFIDFKTRTIIHNEKHAKEIGIDMLEERFPDTIIPRVYPEDLQAFKEFAQSNLRGEEGAFTFRMLVNETDYEWFEVHSYIVSDESGNPEQIVSRVKNVNHMLELQSKVADFNKQFDIIEKISQETLFQVDIQSRVLVHRGNHGALISLNEVEENFPDCVYPRVHPDDLESFKNYAQSIMAGNEENLTFRTLVDGSSTDYEWLELNSYVIYDENNRPEQIVGTVKNVHSQQEMIKRANTDMLTGCLNKMATLEQVSAILHDTNIHEKHALLFLDLDDFKYVNDNLGHAFGDYLLKELGKRLSENIRAQDLVGRVGGDEFVLFLQNIPSEEILFGKGKIILSSISEDFVEGDKKHNIKGSIGIAVYPDHGTSYEELYHHADIALYQSKHKGKNTVNIFSFSNEIDEK